MSKDGKSGDMGAQDTNCEDAQDDAKETRSVARRISHQKYQTWPCVA